MHAAIARLNIMGSSVDPSLVVQTAVLRVNFTGEVVPSVLELVECPRKGVPLHNETEV
jgi:hypothetical protein